MQLIDSLIENCQLIKRMKTDKNTVMLMDHCFGIKGKGTVLTGTILQGELNRRDKIESVGANPGT